MKIDTSKTDPYTAIEEAVRKLTMKDGYEVCADYIVRIKTSVLGTSNELMIYTGNDVYEFVNDWYEGGTVELLGVIAVEDVNVPSCG